MRISSDFLNSRIENQKMLKGQDILLLLRSALLPPAERLTLQELSVELGLSVSAVHASVERCKKSGLMIPLLGGNSIHRQGLIEVIIHGVKYFFPAERGEITRGIPTAHAAPPLSSLVLGQDIPVVWPHPEGWVRGESFEPIYRSVPDAALKNSELYELLVLVDALRGGRARERQLASQLITERLSR